MTPSGGRTHLPHRARAVALGVVLPAAILAASVLLVSSWRDRLPDPVAVHWGASGAVDRVGSFADLVLPPLVIGGVGWVVLALLSVLTGRSSLTRRMTIGLAVGMATLIGGVLVAATWAQLDAPHAGSVPVPAGTIGLAVGAALLLGALAALLAGRDEPLPATTAVPDDAARLELPDGVQAVWVATAGVRHPWVLATAVVLLVGGGGLLAVLTAQWWLLATTALVGLLMAGLTTWTVQVDAGGLTARANLGRPRLHVPADEVERADTTVVDPFTEFGGWGVRTAIDGRTGVVTRKGEAILVRRTGGRLFVVTVDDAARGAALLNTMAARARSAPRA